MPISFANIPANIKVPMYYVEVDPSMAGLPSINLIALLTGIMLASYQSVETAVVASGGSGYTAGNTIDLGNGVVVTVDTVTAGAVATATLTDPGTIAADATPPANPVPQVSSSGGGTGATFTLTWQTTNHPNAGTATPNVPVPVGSQAMADQFFGAGSELSRMFQAFYPQQFRQRGLGPADGRTGGLVGRHWRDRHYRAADAGRDLASLSRWDAHPDQHHDDRHDRRHR